MKKYDYYVMLLAIVAIMIITLAGLFSCATGGGFTPKGAAVATNAVNVATGILKALDGGLYATYMGLIENGLITGNEQLLVTSTRQLSGLDSATTTAKAVIAGVTVTDKELNVAAGMVDGSRAILKAVK